MFFYALLMVCEADLLTDTCDRLTFLSHYTVNTVWRLQRRDMWRERWCYYTTTCWSIRSDMSYIDCEDVYGCTIFPLEVQFSPWTKPQSLLNIFLRHSHLFLVSGVKFQRKLLKIVNEDEHLWQGFSLQWCVSTETHSPKSAANKQHHYCHGGYDTGTVCTYKYS